MKKSLLTILSVTLLLLGAAGFALQHTGRLRLLSVQSDSMAPALRHGDVITVEPVAFADMRVGDVVAYRSPLQPPVIITHRVVSINQGRQVLLTRGDAAAIIDAPTPAAFVLGKVTHHVAGLGIGLTFLRGMPGLAIACYLPAFLIILAEINLFLVRRVEVGQQSTHA